MKILAIRGQNLASLARNFAVELAQPPLADAGLFAITGPVGAGKSTLLDAMCLALFDRTPRLSGSGGAPVGDDERAQADWLRANDPRSLLRRDAADGFAEVDFVGRDGVVYRARWSVRRAYRKADGRVQKQELLLTEPGRDLVVASGLRTEVLAAIRQRLGLDFQQFCRSVLLAQGEFHAFLRAAADERARLLETLTGASIYRRLSKAAHQRRRDGEKDVARLREQITQCEVLPAEQRAALEARRGQFEQRILLCKAAVEAAQRHVSWHETAELLQRSESEATVGLQEAQRRVVGAAARRQDLERRQRALAAAPRWEVAQEARLALREAELASAAATKELANVQRGHDTVDAQLRRALRDSLAVGEVPPLVEELPRWRALLERLARAEQAGRAAASALPAAVRTAEEATQRREELQRGIAPLVEGLAAADEVAQRALARGEHDGAAVASRRAARSALAAERDVLRNAESLAKAWSDATTARGAGDRRAGQLRELLRRAGAAADRAVADVADAERACLAARDAAAHAERHHGLAALRAELVDGEGCPLCGSRTHDVAAFAVPHDLAALQQAAASAEARLAAARAAASERKGDHRAAQRAADDAAAAAQTLGERVDAARAALREAASRIAMPLPEHGDVAAAVAEGIEHARSRLEARERDLEAADAAAAAQADELRCALAGQVAGRQALQRAREELAAAEAAERDAVARLAALHGDAERALAGLEEARQELGEACASAPLVARVEALGGARVATLATLHDFSCARRVARDEVTTATTAHAAAGAAAAQRRAAAAAAEQALQRALNDSGVVEDDVAVAFRLGAQALHVEAEALRKLDDEVLRLRAVVQERTKRRREHDEHDRPMLDKEDALAALEQTRAERASVERQRDDVHVKLAVDDAAKKQLGALLPRVEAAEQQLAVWVALDELIGSSGGDAFAVFAQGLTLDLLLLEANRRLAELARRYRLERIGTGELDFVVVDLDMGGNRRSLWSLSGGETFLVSLALALALATLAAEHSRVETMFLDEGFGTLDAQNLEVALAALDSLQATGCQVGVISHVDGFAERIGAVVEIRPEGSGQSRVVVPAR
ncbi:MAG: AAA family ATPase [Planctomycetes bacterium]|nr:AAA family ATPase [Planctomycetota bacterium]